MVRKLSRGQVAILAMFAAVAIYAGSLVLMKEPTLWRSVPEDGMSRNGLAYSEEIVALRLYYMPRRSFPFYFADERLHYEPLARVGDPATIRQILDLLKPGAAAAESGCRPAKRDAMLHVITYREDGTVYGYVVLQAGTITDAAPGDARDCTIAWLHEADQFISWPVYDARARLTEITGVKM